MRWKLNCIYVFATLEDGQEEKCLLWNKHTKTNAYIMPYERTFRFFIGKNRHGVMGEMYPEDAYIMYSEGYL